MKGTNTIIVNSEQMNSILSKWWSDTTYGTKDNVTDVQAGENGNFEITLDEIIKEPKKEEE